jgi:hypothetical protein
MDNGVKTAQATSAITFLHSLTESNVKMDRLRQELDYFQILFADFLRVLIKAIHKEQIVMLQKFVDAFFYAVMLSSLTQADVFHISINISNASNQPYTVQIDVVEPAALKMTMTSILPIHAAAIGFIVSDMTCKTWFVDAMQKTFTLATVQCTVTSTNLDIKMTGLNQVRIAQ